MLVAFKHALDPTTLWKGHLDSVPRRGDLVSLNGKLREVHLVSWIPSEGAVVIAAGNET